jgi:hypothetical protein
MNWKRWLLVAAGLYFLVRGFWPAISLWWLRLWARWGISTHAGEVILGVVLLGGALVARKKRPISDRSLHRKPPQL